jgi:hypothetical protein
LSVNVARMNYYFFYSVLCKQVLPRIVMSSSVLILFYVKWNLISILSS